MKNSHWFSRTLAGSRWLVSTKSGRVALLLLVGLLSLGGISAVSLRHRAVKAAAQPHAPNADGLASALNADGTLKSGASGSFDARGFKMRYGASGAPVFVQTGTEDDRWDGRFGSQGLDSWVNAIAIIDSSNLYVGGAFTTAGGVTVNHIAHWNGSVWSALRAGLNDYVYTMQISGSNLYVGGAFTSSKFHNGTFTSAKYIARWDGTNWFALGEGVDGPVWDLAASGNTVYAGGNFITAGGVSARKVACWNGTAWSPLGAGLSNDAFAVAINGSDVYVGGTFTTAGGVSANRIARWNGSAWSALGSGLDDKVHDIKIASNNLIYAGGDFDIAGGIAAKGIARWNGTAWSAVGNGQMDGDVETIELSGEVLYVGGSFSSIGGVSAQSVARWDGSWSAQGNGIAGRVAAIGRGSFSLFVGGEFTQAGALGETTAANNIAFYNTLGGPWSALNSGLNNAAYAITVRQNTLYVGGNFTEAGARPRLESGGTIRKIAQFDLPTAKWGHAVNGMADTDFVTALAAGDDIYVGGFFEKIFSQTINNLTRISGGPFPGGGTNNPVRAIVLNGSNVYIGGSFTTVGGVAANFVARWNGSAWSPLGTGMDGEVKALAFDSNGNLYAGGEFNTAGGVSASGIAVWNGSAWSAVVGSFARGNFVNALAITGLVVYAGGYITQASGASVNNIVRLSSGRWEPLGSGVNNNVNALAFGGNDLYVGGAFTTAGGGNIKYIARWNGSSWFPLGSGTNNEVNALAVSGTNVFIGGGFTQAGGKASNYFGRYSFNTAPTITASAALMRQQGSRPGSPVTIATVSDLHTTAGSLTVTAPDQRSGITVTGITNTNGTISAVVSAQCSRVVSNNRVTLYVSDGEMTSTADLLVNETANTAPTLGAWPATTATLGNSATVTPAAAPTDNGQIASLTMTNAGTFTGTASVNASTGVITISNARPAGSHTITLTATDNCGLQRTNTLTLQVDCPTITVNPASLPNATMGAAYSQTFTQTGGAGAITFALASGTLPNGLTLTGATLAGVPTQAGTFTFTVRATDANGCTGSRAYSLTSTMTVTPPAITALAPNSAIAGTTAFALTVNGTNFVNGAIVNWNGAARVTTFVSATQVRAAIAASDLATAGTVNVTVVNPNNGGTSNAASFVVHPATARFEADVWPLPNGDGVVNQEDVRLLARYYLRLEKAPTGNAFQKADCAPRGSLGNQRISISDVVQAIRYANGTDPLVLMGGPTAPAFTDETLLLIADEQALAAQPNGSLGALLATIPRGQAGSAQVQLTGTGNEGAVAFTANFDPAKLTFLDAAKAASLPAGAEVIVNDTQAAQGKIGVLLYLGGGQTLPTGANNPVNLRLIPNGGSGTTSITLSYSDDVTARESGNVTGLVEQPLASTTATASVTGASPAFISSASFSGGAVAAPDGIMSIFGLDLATGIPAGGVTARTIPLPTTLGGTTVTITDSAGTQLAAPLFYVGTTQVNCLIPTNAAEGLATVAIRNASNVTTSGLMRIVRLAPGLFSFNGNGKGVAAASALRVLPNQTSRFENLARYDDTLRQWVTTPIDLGAANEQVFVVLYGTGLRGRSALAEVSANVGGTNLPVAFAGAQGSLVGLDQINLLLPRTLIGRGELDLTLTADGRVTNTVKINIK